MKKYIKSVVGCVTFIGFATFFVFMAVSLLNWMLELSVYNTLSDFKAIDMNQLLIGLWFSISFHFIIFVLFLLMYVTYRTIEQDWPFVNKLFSIFNRLFLPSLFSFWMLLSFRSELFSLISTVLATAVLFADFRKNSKSFEIFPVPNNHRPNHPTSHKDQE